MTLSTLQPNYQMVYYLQYLQQQAQEADVEIEEIEDEIIEEPVKEVDVSDLFGYMVEYEGFNNIDELIEDYICKLPQIEDVEMTVEEPYMYNCNEEPYVANLESLFRGEWEENETMIKSIVIEEPIVANYSQSPYIRNLNTLFKGEWEENDTKRNSLIVSEPFEYNIAPLFASIIES